MASSATPSYRYTTVAPAPLAGGHNGTTRGPRVNPGGRGDSSGGSTGRDNRSWDTGERGRRVSIGISGRSGSVFGASSSRSSGSCSSFGGGGSGGSGGGSGGGGGGRRELAAAFLAVPLHSFHVFQAVSGAPASLFVRSVTEGRVAKASLARA